MSKATYPLKLPLSVKKAAQRLAKDRAESGTNRQTVWHLFVLIAFSGFIAGGPPDKAPSLSMMSPSETGKVPPRRLTWRRVKPSGWNKDTLNDAFNARENKIDVLDSSSIDTPSVASCVVDS